jgi:hypothetical protein
MSMIGIILRVANQQLNDFLNDSALLEEFSDSEGIEESGNQLDLDKSWDAINFLLTGHSLDTIETAEPPLSQIIFSGQIIDEDQDMGYGPAQYLKPEQVREINTALSKVSILDFRQKYNAGKMNEKGVYPQAWQDDEDEKDYLCDNFENLKAFYEKASQEGQAIITYIA